MTSLTDALANFSIHRDGRNTLVVRSRLTVEELEQALAAARRVAQAPQISWCATHNCPSRWPTATNCRHGADVGRPEDCRMVRKLLVDPPKENT